MPPSITEAALGVGASQQQAVFHHVLPLALPGIMTGTILGLARAFGETAPLLMIGMVAFIVDVPHGFTDAATVLPVQIFLWSDLPEVAFQSKTAAAIIVLLVVLFASMPSPSICASASNGAGKSGNTHHERHQSIITPAHPAHHGASGQFKITARDVDVYYGDKHAIKNLSIDIPDRAVSAFIGPSGCGKSTFLRCINRMNDTIPTCRVTGLHRCRRQGHL